MNSKNVVIVKPQSLSAKDKEKLTKNGYVVVEHPFPQDVRVIQPIEEATGNSTLMAALHAIVEYNVSGVALPFVKDLYRRLKESESK